MVTKGALQPLDTAKTLLQVSSATTGVRYRNLAHLLLAHVRSRKVNRLYRGFIGASYTLAHVVLSGTHSVQAVVLFNLLYKSI